MKSKNLEELHGLSTTKKIWLHFKVGNKLVARDFWRWAKGDMWPWLQTLMAIIFIVIIVLAEAFLIANFWAMLLMLVLFVAFNLYAMWRTYKLERC
jgi:hypothetical protein